MANSTATTLNDLLNTEVIVDITLDAARAATFMPRIVWQKDITGSGSYVANFPRYAALAAAALTDGTDMSATALSTDQAGQITAAEVGVLVTLTDKASKGAAGRIDVNAVGRQCGLAVADKLETDLTATFGSFSTSVGSTGVDLSLVDIDDAIYNLKLVNAPIGNPTEQANPVGAFGQFQAVLHSRQMADLRTALRAANFAFVSPLQMNLLEGAGKTMNGLAGEYLGVMFWESTTVATANTGADRCGAMFVPAALGLVTYGGPSIELQRDASLRATEVNCVQIYGAGIACNPYGVKIVTDA
jgi:hypothetical protein